MLSDCAVISSDIFFSSKRDASFSVELDDDDLLTAADNMLDLSSRMYWTSLFPIPALHSRKIIKRATYVPPYSSVQSHCTQSTLTFTPHSQKQTMFFQKSIISFVAVAALAASVSASSIAARQGVQCPAGLESYCCPQPIPFSSLPSGPQGALPGAAPNLDQSKEVCENFTTPPGQGSWYDSVFPPPFFFLPASHEMANAPL